MSESPRNFSSSDWENTPQAVKDEFLRLEQQVKELKDKLDQLFITVNKDSSNSSKPSSSDSPYKKKTNPKKPKSA
jgi:transposase